MALDFVSLVLSKHAPATAESTMSPALRQAVPRGSLNCQLMTNNPPSMAESKAAHSISETYTLCGFSQAAEKLTEAASRLEGEADQESKYWKEVLLIQKKGWPLSKLPGDPCALAVHFGFQDAAPAYRSRGFAVLARNPDGTLRLDHNPLRPNPVRVRASIVREGSTCGCSSASTSSGEADSVVVAASIDQQILQARDTLFEDELFHELGREARLLANHGVTMSLKQIKVPMDDETHLQLDLKESESKHPAKESSKQDQSLAEAISLGLRILLSHAHEINLLRRSQPPLPLSLEPRSMPECALLRPLLGAMQHLKQRDQLVGLLRSLIEPLVTAGLPISLKQAEASLNPGSHNNAAYPSLPLSTMPSAQRNTAATLLESLTKPLATSFTLVLPTEREQTITAQTNFDPPIFGTEFNFSANTLTYHNVALSFLPVTTFEAIERLFRHLLLVDLVSFTLLNLNKHVNDAEAIHASPTDDNRDIAKGDSAGKAGEKIQAKDRRFSCNVLDQHTGSFVVIDTKSSSDQAHNEDQGNINTEPTEHRRGKKIWKKFSLQIAPGRFGLQCIKPVFNTDGHRPLIQQNILAKNEEAMDGMTEGEEKEESQLLADDNYRRVHPPLSVHPDIYHSNNNNTGSNNLFSSFQSPPVVSNTSSIASTMYMWTADREPSQPSQQRCGHNSSTHNYSNKDGKGDSDNGRSHGHSDKHFDNQEEQDPFKRALWRKPGNDGRSVERLDGNSYMSFLDVLRS